MVAALVVNVVDGDTIDVPIDGTEFRLRYIGIDTPETVHPTRVKNLWKGSIGPQPRAYAGEDSGP